VPEFSISEICIIKIDDIVQGYKVKRGQAFYA
jgi:hypothetical protein